MFVGTGSDVGKSVINAAFCRIFLQDGYTPAPFKAQNMSLNSYPTPDGLEIGRAQAVQAEACGIPCRVEMNPVLLKPTSNMSSQVVLHGKPIGNKSASEYFMGTDREMLFKEAMSAFYRLEANYNPIVVEGAGSISEINLWDKDITNMRVALAANAPTYLIADIDKGGVFASVYGTIALLPQEQKDLIKGIIINKFRGDITLFHDGRKILENLTGKPVVGVIPYFKDIIIEQEDSVVVDRMRGTAGAAKINIAVVLLRHMSNFTDFNQLEQIPEVHLYYARTAEDVLEADIVIIPGSKNTIEDLIDLRKRGVAQSILQHHTKGKAVYGICGGYQMMGSMIEDPDHIEGDCTSIPGLGLLPVTTVMTKDKKTEQCRFTFLGGAEVGEAYEIHMGQTSAKEASPLCQINGNAPEGYFLNPKTWGTYLHGIFDNKEVVEYILKQIDPATNVQMDYAKFKNDQYDRLAQLVRESVDMKYIYGTLDILE